MEMLEDIEVRELVCGVSSDEEIATVHEWIKMMHATDQSMDLSLERQDYLEQSKFHV